MMGQKAFKEILDQLNDADAMFYKTRLYILSIMLNNDRSDFKFDTVIMNPPFGTKNNEGIDMMFLETALNAITSDGAVYSFHKTSTRDFVVKKFQDRRYHVTVLAEMKFKIPQMYRQHRKKEVFVDVDFIRIIAQKSSDCGG